MTDRKINVLVVDDSTVTRLNLVRLLDADPQLRVIGAVADGPAALDFIRDNPPDVVLMDIHMPGMDGFEATRRIMETRPVPIIICSATTDTKEIANSFRLMEAGAVACVEKPVGREHADFDAVVANLLQTVKLMSEVRVVRRWAKVRGAPGSAPGAAENPAAGAITCIGIGASTGGPPVLQTILGGLPKSFPAPILIVQHITPGFLPGLAEWLSQTTGLQVHIGSYGMLPLPGHVYLAPDGFQMGLTAGRRLLLTKEDPENGLRPSVAYLFRSLADVCGSAAVGVLLTGMGKDGAVELRRMRDKGSVTIAQNQETSVVHGMPGEAIALDGAVHVLPADKIADQLVMLLNHRNGQGNHAS
jgi:two-component system chemotaxis response regulator CheB